MKKTVLLWAMIAIGCAQVPDPKGFPTPAIDRAPRHYFCRKATVAPVIDGRLDDDAWGRVEWTSNFVDITGDPALAPRFRTRAKLLFDDAHLYIAAELSEPHVWGTITERDAVIFHDNDFEVFLDPDGDTHEYYEIEINALGTVWDLLIPEPYRDGGHGVNAWDLRGLKSAIHVDGTLNDPTDEDRSWSVEMAIPLGPLFEALPGDPPPKPGDRWRINFSRVQWRHVVTDGGYRKKRDPETGKDLAEDNWSWSPQGLVNMHYPEMWGYLVFADSNGPLPKWESREYDRLDGALRRVYYAQRRYRAAKGRYAPAARWLGLTDPPAGLRLQATENRFEAELPLGDGTRLRITEDGRTRIIRKEGE